MAHIDLSDEKNFFGRKTPYFVAEMNSSHNGNMETAKKMVDSALKCGCDAVKFQSWSAETLYSADYYRENPIAKRMIDKFALEEEDLEELAFYCKQCGIAFSSTPYSDKEVDFLVKVKAEYIKVASMDLNNIPFLDYIGKTGLPIVLSTGMGSLEEIHRAVKTIEGAGNKKICILHCVSIYPVQAEHVNLNNIKMLRREFPEYPTGYSDHTIGSEVSCAAVALGAIMIEKHFTLDNSRIGWDNQMAAEPPVMRELIEKCRKAYSALGSYDRKVTADEMEQKQKMRRSIVAGKALEVGHILKAEDIDSKRPGTGIPPECYKEILGKKINRTIGKDEMLREEDFYD